MKKEKKYWHIPLIVGLIMLFIGVFMVAFSFYKKEIQYSFIGIGTLLIIIGICTAFFITIIVSSISEIYEEKDVAVLKSKEESKEEKNLDNKHQLNIAKNHCPFCGNAIHENQIICPYCKRKIVEQKVDKKEIMHKAHDMIKK